MSNIKFAAICIILSLLALVGYSYHRYHAQSAVTKVLTAEVKRADAIVGLSNSVASSRNEAVVAFHKQREVQDARTEIALQAHPKWANEPLPDDVLDALGVR